MEDYWTSDPLYKAALEAIAICDNCERVRRIVEWPTGKRPVFDHEPETCPYPKSRTGKVVRRVD